MKKWMAVLSVVFLTSPLFALQDGNGKLEIAYETESYGYREPHMQYPIKISGRKQGVSLTYTRNNLLSAVGMGEDNSFGTLELRYLRGKVDYNGFLWDGTTATSDDERDYYYEGRLFIGKHMAMGDYFTLSPYFGLGYRYLCNHAEKSPGGYKRESTYFYMPFGAGLAFHPGNGWSATLSGEFDWMINGNQRSQMSDTGNFDPPYQDFHYKDVTNDQTKGFGLRAGFKVEKDFGGFGLFAEPFYRFWKIQNSEVEPLLATNGTETVFTGRGLVEPFNITREYGVKIGVTF